MKEFKFGNKQISETSRPFIISEIGVNYYDIAKKEHIENIEAAKLMIRETSKAGADAVKFQSYKAEKIASRFSPAYWDTTKESTKSQYELFKKYDHFGEDEYRELAKYAQSQDVIFISTPFDFESADYLNDLMPLYKISSSDLTNLPFVSHIAKKGKPIFLSTGASTLGEIEIALNTILKTGNEDICLLHCVLCYPTEYVDANLNMIKHLEAVFPDFLIGYSDHTLPDKTMMTLTTAYLYGAKVIEKHFTLDKTLLGNDHYHAMDSDDLKTFVSNINLLLKISGQYYKRPLQCENESRKQARRSISAKTDLLKGEILTTEKVTFKRPGTGISPADINKVLGRKLLKNVMADELINWDDF